jgi:hypothetical protein
MQQNLESSAVRWVRSKRCGSAVIKPGLCCGAVLAPFLAEDLKTNFAPVPHIEIVRAQRLAMIFSHNRGTFDLLED